MECVEIVGILLIFLFFVNGGLVVVVRSRNIFVKVFFVKCIIFNVIFRGKSIVLIMNWL